MRKSPKKLKDSNYKEDLNEAKNKLLSLNKTFDKMKSDIKTDLEDLENSLFSNFDEILCKYKENIININVPNNKWIIEVYDDKTEKLIETFNSMGEVRKWFYKTNVSRVFPLASIIKARVNIIKIGICRWL